MRGSVLGWPCARWFFTATCTGAPGVWDTSCCRFAPGSCTGFEVGAVRGSQPRVETAPPQPLSTGMQPKSATDQPRRNSESTKTNRYFFGLPTSPARSPSDTLAGLNARGKPIKRPGYLALCASGPGGHLSWLRANIGIAAALRRSSQTNQAGSASLKQTDRSEVGFEAVQRSMARGGRYNEWRDSCDACFCDQAGPKRMGSAESRIESSRCDRFFHNLADGVEAQRLQITLPVAIQPREQWPALRTSDSQPSIQRPYRTGRFVGSARHGDQTPVALRVVLLPSDQHDESLITKCDVFPAEHRQIRPSQSTCESDQQKAAIPYCGRRPFLAEYECGLAKFLDSERPHLPKLLAAQPAGPAEKLAYGSIRRRRIACPLVHVSDSRSAPRNGRYLFAGELINQKKRKCLAGRGHGDAFDPGAPLTKVFPIAFVSILGDRRQFRSPQSTDFGTKRFQVRARGNYSHMPEFGVTCWALLEAGYRNCHQFCNSTFLGKNPVGATMRVVQPELFGRGKPPP